MEPLRQGESFTDTAGRTGIVNFDTQTGQRLAQGATTQNPAVISAQSLNPVTPLVLPQTSVPQFGGMEGALGGVVANQKQLSDEQVQINELKQNKDQSLQALLGSITESGTISSSVDRSAEDAAKMRVNQYTSQLEQEQLALRRQIEAIDKNPQGFFGGGAEVEKNRLTRESLSKQADIAILQSAALRDYDTMAAIADRKVALKMEESRARIQALTFLYQENKSEFTKAEQRQFEKKIREEEREYQKEYKREEQNNAMLLNAIQGNAPQSVITKAQQLINSGASTNEVAKALGRYSLSLSERLDQEYKRAQIGKINADISDMGSSAKLKAIQEAQAKEVENENKRIGLTTTLSKIDALLDNTSGLNKSSGTIQLGRQGLFGLGSKQKFLADANQILSKETLRELVDVKSQGATFGSLDAGERVMLANSATALNGYAKRDKTDKITAFVGREEDIRKEIETIKTLTQIAYIRAGGTLPGTPAEKILADDITNTALPLILQSTNYGGYNLGGL